MCGPDMNGRSYIACACAAVYERTTEMLPRHEKGVFRCACGADLGAWNGLLALRYRRIADPDSLVMLLARRPRAA